MPGLVREGRGEYNRSGGAERAHTHAALGGDKSSCR